MNYKSSFGKSIDEAFATFMKDNPEVYQHYVHFAIQWLKTGAKKISSKQIIGRIRWEVQLNIKGESAREFKCSDIITSRMSRKFVEDYPEYQERFEFRRLRS